MGWSVKTSAKTRRICNDALLLTGAMMLSYLEAILPLELILPLPGFRLGLCHIVITLSFVWLTPWDAAAISFCRVLLMGILFGNGMSFAFSLCGGALAYGGLWLLLRVCRGKFSMIGVCVGCAVLHNLGQLLVAWGLFGGQVVLSYLPWLLVASLVFGSITGIILNELLRKWPKVGQARKKDGDKS